MQGSNSPIGVGLDRAVRERGVACAEYAIRPAVNIELGFQRGLDVHIGEYAETFFFSASVTFAMAVSNDIFSCVLNP